MVIVQFEKVALISCCQPGSFRTLLLDKMLWIGSFPPLPCPQ